MFAFGQVKAVDDIKKKFKPDKSDFDDLVLIKHARLIRMYIQFFLIIY